MGIGARITLDSVREIELVRAVARDLGRRAQVRFRMRPRYLELQAALRLLGRLRLRDGAGVQAGHPDRRAGRRRAARPSPRPSSTCSGSMSHLGRHRNDLETWRAYAASAGETVAELVDAWDGWQPRELDLGGGYAAPRDPNTWAYGGDLVTAASRRPSRTSPRRSRAACAPGSRAACRLAGVALEIEPGRALHADTGIHLTRVVNLKRQREPLAWRWVETDTTEMFLLDLLVEHCRFPVVAADAHERGRSAGPVDVVGCSCGFDVLAHQVRLAAAASRATRLPSSTRAPTRTPARPTSTRCRGRRSSS